MNDYLAQVMRAPGTPEGSIFAGFENNEKVSLVSGNLIITHPSSPALPISNGRTMQLMRVYNSRHLDAEHAEMECYVPGGTTAPATDVPDGDSWVGKGWKSHLGRLVMKSVNNGCFPEYGYDCARKSYADWTARQISFELPDGTLIPLSGWGLSYPANNTPEWVAKYYAYGSLTCATNPFVVGNGMPHLPCATSTRGKAYYEVIGPDGTVYRLERLVLETYYNHEGNQEYVNNFDRSGWYAFEVVDPVGNIISIDYARSGPYPEAITAIRHTQSDNSLSEITTELWSSADVTAGLTSAVNQGKLKATNSPGPNAATVRYTFAYDSGGQLDRVTLPELSPGQAAGTIDYVQGGGSSGGRISKVVYPTGAVSAYTYWRFVAGEYAGASPLCQVECYRYAGDFNYCASDFFSYQECLGDCHETIRAWRWEWGVSTRTLYPDGEGSEKPSFAWRWDRFFGHDILHEHGGDYNTPINEFTVEHPDGTKEKSQILGRMFPDNTNCVPPCFDPTDGQVSSTTHIDGAGQSIRKKDFTYNEFSGIVAKLQQTTTTYLDDKGACFTPSNTGSARTSTTRVALPNGNFRFRMSITEGDYLKSSDRRVEYWDLEDSSTTSQPPGYASRQAAHVLGAYDDYFLEENGNRVEKQAEFDGQGRIKQVRRRNEWKAVGTNFSDPAHPNPGVNGGSDDSDVVVAVAYQDTKGGLKTLTFSGGDAEPGGATKSYTANYTVAYGRPVTLEMGSGSDFDYLAQDVTLDRSGVMSSSRTPSGIPTSFSYDGLGRLTEINPASTEYSTRVVYPDLATTRVIKSPGPETDVISDPSQVFVEQRYDGLGRTVETRKAMPDGTMAVQVKRYDQMSREIFVSEWINAATWSEADPNNLTWDDGNGYSVKLPKSASGTPLGRVTFYGEPDSAQPMNPLRATVDAFGRVHRVMAADGSVSTTSYCGPHKEVTVTVGTTPSVTRYYFDAMGRLVVVDSEVGAPNPTGADAAYEYDALGNLVTVNLVPSLPANPFDAWKSSSIPAGQVRHFEYDALGRLRRFQVPEKGASQGSANEDWTWNDRYDPLGNLLAWRDPLAVKRGYYFRNFYDAAGRLLKSEKQLGAFATLPPPDESRVGTGSSNLGDFTESTDVGSSGWQVGWINGTTYTPSNGAHPAAWRHVAYPYPSSGACLTAPPNAPNGGGLYLGQNCSYSSVDDKMQVARILLTGVRKDDLLSFGHWRQLRENTTGNLDKFEVFVVLNPSGSTTNDISTRRTAFQLTSKQASLAAWQRVTGLQLGALYSDAEWAEGGDAAQVKSLYLYVAFSKGDTASTGVGTGLVVDEVRLGRPGKETLVANTYDQDACSIPGVDICESGGTSNAFRGTLTTTDSYQDGRLVSTRMNTYQGLNGRLSANRIGVDLAGVGQTTSFLTKMSYNSSGAIQYLTHPYLPNVDAGRTYEFGYRRDQFDGVREAGGVNFVPFGGTHVSYNLAGGLAELKFNNGVSTVIGTEAAQMYRPRSFTVQTAGGASVYWNSGTYQYDPSGNISAIGGQSFSYDLVGRLVNAQMLPQATAPTESTPNTVSFDYDPYGNIKTQDWSSSNPTRNAPPFMEFAARQYGPAGTVSRNRITDADFDYDINGNLRKSNSGGLKHTMLWDARNRMTSVQTGFPGDSSGTTLEARYSYDASGYRTITNPDSGDGKPVVSLRDGSGQLIADYVYSPASARLILEKDYLYGLGQLLVERRRTSAPPSATTRSGLASSGNYNLALTSGTGASSYTLDVRDESGNSSSISSVTPDAQGAFSVPESSLFPDTTNLLRIKKNTGEAEPYSAPLSIAYSPGVTGQAANTVRAIAISREGTNLVIRWSLAAADGKLSRLHFDRADGGGMVPLNQNALPASITSLTVSDQALAVPCGDFRIERIVPGQSSGTMTEFGVGMPPSGSSQNLAIGNGGGCGEDPGPGPGGGGPAPYTLADSFHHRDHLGNLRIETDSAGLVMRDDDGVVEIGRHDYYPFGTEMTEDLGIGSRKRFTGHERDEATGMDYMLARYAAPTTARLLSVDPLPSSANAAVPQSWNRFSYVLNNPMALVDPDGQSPSAFNNALPEERAVIYHAAKTEGVGRAYEIGVAAGSARANGLAFAESFNGGTFDDSTAPNAVQHATTACLLSLAIGPEYTRALTDAHEVGDRGADPQAREMDLSNNAVGLDLATLASSPEACGPLAVSALQAGGLVTAPSAEGSPTPLLDAARVAPMPAAPTAKTEPPPKREYNIDVRR